MTKVLVNDHQRSVAAGKGSYLKGSLSQSSLGQMAACLLGARKARVRERGDFSLLHPALGKDGVNTQGEGRAEAEGRC